MKTCGIVPAAVSDSTPVTETVTFVIAETEPTVAVENNPDTLAITSITPSSDSGADDIGVKPSTIKTLRPVQQRRQGHQPTTNLKLYLQYGQSKA